MLKDEKYMALVKKNLNGLIQQQNIDYNPAQDKLNLDIISCYFQKRFLLY